MSWELRPPVPTDKGTVVAGLAAGLRAVCFVGDDTGDLPAFGVLGQLRAGGVDTLAVAVGGPETPPEVLAAADLVVDGPAGADSACSTGWPRDPRQGVRAAARQLVEPVQG